MPAGLKNLGSTSKRLADGSYRHTFYAWRKNKGDPDRPPAVAAATAPTIEKARAAAEALLTQDAVIKRVLDLRSARKRLALGSVHTIEGLIAKFVAFMYEVPEANSPSASQNQIRGRKTAKDIRGATTAHKKVYRRYLDDFRDKHSDWPLTLFERPEIIADITKWRDQYTSQARAPDYAISAVSTLFQWARQRGYTKADPTADIPSVYRSDRSDTIWRPEHFGYAQANTPPAFFRLIRLAATVGLREGDLIRLRDADVQQGSIAVRTSKRKRLAVIPLTDEARAIIAEMRQAKADFAATAVAADRTPVISTTLAVNERGQPWTKSALDSALRRLKSKVANDPDAPDGMADLHLHDLRGNACTALRKAGYRAARIAVIMGWSERRVEEMLAIYCSGDDLARAMQAELEMEREQKLQTDCKPANRDSAPVDLHAKK